MKILKLIFSPKSLAITLVMVIAVYLCLIAARWQWDKGAAMANQNGIITANMNRAPLDLSQIAEIDPYKNQWQKITLSGSFSSQHQFLVKDSYYNGTLGFEVLQLFHPNNYSTDFWIDRGWVQAGASAETPPTIPTLTTTPITITARVRSENLSHQIHGSFFATGASSSALGDLKSIAHFQGVNAAPYYMDLVSSPNSATGPFTQEQLPDLSTGPHYAYAFQWVLFAIIAVVGRVALIIHLAKEDAE
jgi:surfeit locus 1 family protein